VRILISTLLAVLLGLAASPAFGATLVDFEGVPEGTSITDWYSGVHFYLTDDGASRDAVIAVERTGTRLAYVVAGVDDTTPHGDGLLSDGGTFDYSHYGAWFDNSVSEVSLQFMDFADCVPGAQNGAPVTVGLSAWDVTGALVDTDSITVPYRSLPDGSSLMLSVSGAGIVSVETWGDPDCGNGIDDFMFQVADTDDDGIPDDEDACPESTSDIDAPVPSVRLGTNRWADIDGDGVFETTAPRGKGPMLTFDIVDTAGCSCADIIEELDLGNGHTKFGCSISAMQWWIGQLP